MSTHQQNKPRRNFKFFNAILLAGLALLLCGEAYFGYSVYTHSIDRQLIKKDFSMSNNVTFGLFSIDQWRDRISAVINGQVQGYQMTDKQKHELLIAVEKELHGLVSKTVGDINKPQKSIGGKLKKLAFNTIVDSGSIQAQVRPFAKTIIAKISSPENQDRLKNIAASKINQLEKQTYDSTSVANYKVTQYLYRKYHVSNPVQFNNVIDSQLSLLKLLTYKYVFAMLGCVIFAVILWWLMRKQVELQTPLFIFSLLFAFVMLLVGIATPVIEVDASIKTFHFMLLGKQVEFADQELFFQSKSILGIVNTLIGQPKPDAIVVGSLILLFVVVLPVVRLFAKGVHILSNQRLAKNKALRYLAFESGKWDMADVMIVGMLMTYIGLNTIVKSQLSDLNIHTASLTAETANGTSLQPGYIIFAAYVLFAALLSYIFKRITAPKTN
ncbi:paraquat-inducible protein A [Mucilaginibacter sp. dw_454]|uniref:paraquat-inducible protein A n=1 Tax=Mucilaginibacter sp. dw_454 TaxID=2720079 RepID=UPI001BD3AC06|nr:paraquat-inducible protein A [Mucilaginibacter sp. dw_454]